jgi:hypothetical protein
MLRFSQRKIGAANAKNKNFCRSSVCSSLQANNLPNRDFTFLQKTCIFMPLFQLWGILKGADLMHKRNSVKK